MAADVPRVCCPEHGCLTIQVLWAEGSSRWQLQLSWTAIDGIMKRAVIRGLAARTSPDVRFLAVDETGSVRGTTMSPLSPITRAGNYRRGWQVRR